MFDQDSVSFLRLSQKRFKQLVERLQLFITTRLFPAKPEELPPMSKCSWWIPSATKVLSLLSECENQQWLKDMLIDFAGSESNQFYNFVLCTQMLQTAFLLLLLSPSLIFTISHWTTLTSWRITRRGKLMEIPTGVAQKYNLDQALFSLVTFKHT